MFMPTCCQYGNTSGYRQAAFSPDGSSAASAAEPGIGGMVIGFHGFLRLSSFN